MPPLSTQKSDSATHAQFKNPRAFPSVKKVKMVRRERERTKNACNTAAHALHSDKRQKRFADISSDPISDSDHVAHYIPSKSLVLFVVDFELPPSLVS